MSLKLNSSGGGSVTLQEPSTASNLTVTLPDETGTVVLGGGALGTPSSGNGSNLTNLNASNLASGTVAVARLAATGTPSASTYLRGDSSWATVSGGVTSITAGNGLTGGTITSSGTIALDYYTGSTSDNTSFPLGSYVIIRNNTNSAIATSLTCRVSSGANAFTPGGTSAVAGTWRSRGLCGVEYTCPVNFYYLVQRVA
jgi:hypothetical protein